MAFLDAMLSRFSSKAAFRRARALIDRGDRRAAFPYLARAARAGNADAEFLIGRAYLEGAGVPPSRPEGVRWLEKAAQQDYVEAQGLLATLCLNGMGPEQTAAGVSGSPGLFSGQTTLGPDFETALIWARRAAEGGSAEAQAMMGFILGSGPDHMRDQSASDEWYRRSAEAAGPQGQLGYALVLARLGTNDPAQQEKLIGHLRAASDTGLATAQYLLGMMHDRGVGVPLDEPEAAKLYSQAAAKGHVSAQARWGFALMHGIGVAPNPTEGESWLRRAALAGDPEAAAMVGDLYAKGGPLPPNYAEAAMWFRRAVDAKHKGAARALAMLHLTGAGVPRDQDEAARLFSFAAEGGDPVSLADLGNLLLKGHGETKDSVLTREWFEQAAQSGDMVAAFNYGVCLAAIGEQERARETLETALAADPSNKLALAALAKLSA